MAPSAAAIEDEQPSPKSGFSTTSAHERSTALRTRSELPPIATMSWSKPQLRAVATVWSSSVAEPNGSSCLGSPRRSEPPAASTRPETKRSADGGTARSLRREAVAAALRAEVVGLAVALELDAGGADSDLHPAHRVGGDRERRGFGGRGAGRRGLGTRGRGIGRRGGAGRNGPEPDALRAGVPRRDDLGQDRERDLLGGLGADLEPGGGSQRASQLLGEIEGGPHRLAALVTGDEGDVGDALAEGFGEHSLLLASVRGDDHRGVGSERAAALRVLALHRVAEPRPEPLQGKRDRGGADDPDGRRRQARLQEDLQGAPAEAGVLDRDRALARLRLTLR